ncbi:MAG: hypothetical protein IKK43_00880 [Clostridia bacterium]|nr:hypothetical protein [Clostridia bacterium]
MANGSKILLAVVSIIIIIFGIFFVSNINDEEELNLPVINNAENVENNGETKKEEEKKIPKYVQMYLNLLDDIMETDSGLNGNSEFVSVDVESLDKEYMDPEIKGTTRVFDISEEDEQIILDYMKKYHDNIKSDNFEELKAQGEFDEKNLVLDGILIYVSNIEIVSEDNFIISMVKYRSGLGAIFPEYSVKYIDGNWEIDVVSMAIS